MEEKKTNILLLISVICLLIAGIIFLLIALFNDHESNWFFEAAIVCIVLSNLFNVVRTHLSKKGEQ